MKILATIFDLISGTWGLIVKIALVILAIVVVVGFVKSCAANASLDEHSSCQQFEQADSATQDRVLQDMMTAHHDQGNIALTRASLTLYCNVYGGNAPIDGIYNGGDVGQQPAQALDLHLPASLTALMSFEPGTA